MEFSRGTMRSFSHSVKHGEKHYSIHSQAFKHYFRITERKTSIDHIDSSQFYGSFVTSNISRILINRSQITSSIWKRSYVFELLQADISFCIRTSELGCTLKLARKFLRKFRHLKHTR